MQVKLVKFADGVQKPAPEHVELLHGDGTWQLNPVYPGGHMQLKPFKLGTQVPPFKQVDGWHWINTVSHLGPVNPGKQQQPPFQQLPPFKQGLEVG